MDNALYICATKQKDMKTNKGKIVIEKINYFGGEDFNAKALYRKNGKLYLCHIHIDFFNLKIYAERQQPKECKVLTGFEAAVNAYAKETNWLFA